MPLWFYTMRMIMSGWICEANGMPKERYVTTGTIELYGPPTFEGAKFKIANENIEFNI